jgi:hypothetical protein
MGLSQPLDKNEVEQERKAGKSYSARGLELGFLTNEQCGWPPDALYLFLTHITDGIEIAWGDRFAFGFFEPAAGEMRPFTGHPEALGIAPIGEIRAVLFWRYLFPNWEFRTSTGKFMILIATGITKSEWDLAKETSPYHLLVLLVRAGISQRTIIDRKCLLDDPRWCAEWRKIKSLDQEDCGRELEARGRDQ